MAGNWIQFFFFSNIRLEKKKFNMKVNGIKAQIATNVVDGMITQFEMGGNQLAWVVYKKLMYQTEVTEMMLLTFTTYENQPKPHMFVLGLYRNYDELAGTDLRSTQILTFDPDPLTAKNYLLIADKGIKWSLLYTEAYSLKFKKKFHVKLVGMEEQVKKLASTKDMIFMAIDNVVKIYRIRYDMLEKSQEYTVDFDEVFYLM